MALTTPVWSVPAATNFSRGVVADDLVVFGDMIGELKAVRIADGSIVWNVRIEDGIREDLLLHEGVVYGASLRPWQKPNQESVAFAADPRSGEILWTSTLAAWTVQGPLVLRDEVLFITSGENQSGRMVHRLSRATGDPLGTAWLPGKDGVILELRGSEIIYFLDGGTDLIATDVDTGAWSVKFRAPRTLEYMILDGEQAYVSFTESPQLSVISCVHLPTGQLRWTHFLDRACAGLHLHGGKLVVRAFVAMANGMASRTPAETGQILCIDGDDGLIKWRFSFGTERPGSLAFQDGRILVSMARRSDGPGDLWLATVFLLDLESGAELLHSEQPARPEWVIPLSPVSVVSHGDAVYGFEFGHVWRRPAGGRVRSIGLNDLSILAGLSNGQIKAVSRTAAAIQWTATLTGPIGACPATAQGLVMVGDKLGLVALGASDGILRWRCASGKPVAAAPRVIGDMVIFGSRDEFVRAVRIADGEPFWTFKTDGFVEGLSVGDGDNIYVPSGDGTFYCLDTQGKLRWSYATNEVLRSAPMTKPNLVVVADAAGVVHGLAPETGALVWKVQVGASHAATPVSAGSQTFWVAEDGVLPDGTGRVFQLSVEGGVLLRTVNLNSRVRGELAVSGERLFVSTEIGDVVVLDLETGEHRQLVPLGARTQCGVVLAPDGVLAGDEAGMLHLLTR